MVKRVARCTGFNRQLAVVGHIKVQKTFSQHRLFGSSGCIDDFIGDCPLPCLTRVALLALTIAEANP